MVDLIKFIASKLIKIYSNYLLLGNLELFGNEYNILALELLVGEWQIWLAVDVTIDIFVLLDK